MDVLVATGKILSSIINDHISFGAALKAFREQKTGTKNEINMVGSLTHVSLKHLLASQNFLKTHLSVPLVPNEETYLIALISEVAFHHKLSDEVLNKSISELYAEDNSFSLTVEEVEILLTLVKATPNLLPLENDVTSEEYLSLKYNTPAWLVKMWGKMMSVAVLERYLKANQYRAPNTFRVNPLLTTRDFVLATDAKFSAGPATNSLIYTGNKSIRNHELVQKDFIYAQPLAESYVYDLINVKKLEDCLIYESRFNHSYLDLSYRSENKLKIDLAVAAKAREINLEYELTHAKIKNIFVFHSAPSSIITALRSKRDLVVVIPNNSQFDLIRKTPDYFLHFNQDDLDNYIFEAKTALEECAAFTRNGGQLLYLVNTCSNKEGHGLIEDFIMSHRDFSLVSEKQFLPIDEYKSTLYYALLSRKDVHNA